MRTKLILFIFLFGNSQFCVSQGRAANWLLGYDVGLFDTNVTSTKAFLSFDSVNVNVRPANFTIPFLAAQANMSDETGNLLFVSNGCWIADSSGSLMQNGDSLTQGGFWASWCDPVTGIPFNQSTIALPNPNDSNKYYLLHQASTAGYFATDMYFTEIDMSLNGGLGSVPIGQKNRLLLHAVQNTNVVACKHANGRDWWIVTFEHLTDSVFVVLLSPSGFSNPVKQSLGISLGSREISQSQFSPDGKQFAYTMVEDSSSVYKTSVRLFDFDRCNGNFSNLRQFNYIESIFTLGLMFSPSSNNLYVASLLRLYQFNVDSFQFLTNLDTVAIYDGYYSPYPPFQSAFWLLYRAANGKIYGTSGSGVIDLHFINYPDSAGLACDVQQHALHLPCFSGRGNVNHPNYYLGCDTTLGCPCLVSTGLNEYSQHNFSIKLSPNPGSSGFEILYLLPQNKNGILKVYDLQGRLMDKQILPQWSTMQHIPASNWAPGIYQVRIESEGYFSTNKWVKY